MGEAVRVWLAERTYSDDEQNVVILEYATPEGDRYLRKELAAGAALDRPTPVSITVDPDRLAPVQNEAVRERYAATVAETRADHDVDDTLE
ncbi:MAG: hypothetical protein ABEJ42_07820 [Halobacteriaceae archaeon]